MISCMLHEEFLTSNAHTFIHINTYVIYASLMSDEYKLNFHKCSSQMESASNTLR